LWSIQGSETHENSGIIKQGNHLAADTSHKVLQIFHFTLIAEQLQAYPNLLGICNASIEVSWRNPGKSSGNMAHIALQSVGYARL
jgi:hypothetical protein